MQRYIKSGYDILNVGNKTPAGNLVFYLVNDGKRMPIMTEDYAIREGGYDKDYLYEGSKNGEFLRFDGFSSIINRLAKGCGLGEEEIEQIEYSITGNKVDFTVYPTERGIHLLNNGWWDDYSVKWELSAEEQIPLYGADEKIAMSVELTILGLSNDLTSSRKITSARYIATDPETGEVLGSADTYEEAVNEWGEDVTITDSEAAEGEENMGLFQSRRPIKSSNVRLDYDGMTGCYSSVLDDGQWFSYASSDMDDLSGWSYGTYDDGEIIRESWEGLTPEEVNESCSRFENEVKNRVMDRNTVKTIIDDFYDKTGVSNITSSKKPETTKQFVTRILSELETGEITEDEAAEEIAEANDVNIGYARQILSSYIADKDRYITSGMLELGDALNVEFDPDGNLDSWSVDFATDPEKPAPTLGGELVRAARHIISAFRDNDEKVGWGYAREVLNPAARFIVENTEYKQNDVFEDLLDGQTYNDDAYRQFIDMFETDFADYLRDHEELFHKLNKKSFEENVNDEDEYSSIDYFSVNNEHVDYWFKYEDGQYVCDNVDPVVNQEWNEGDIITAEDFPFDNIDFNEEYGTFDYDDGFIYSWEDGDGESVRISNVEYKYSEFEEGDVLTPDELENLAENGYEFHDANGNEIRISDIM